MSASSEVVGSRGNAALEEAEPWSIVTRPRPSVVPTHSGVARTFAGRGRRDLGTTSAAGGRPWSMACSMVRRARSPWHGAAAIRSTTKGHSNDSYPNDVARGRDVRRGCHVRICRDHQAHGAGGVARRVERCPAGRRPRLLPGLLPGLYPRWRHRPVLLGRVPSGVRVAVTRAGPARRPPTARSSSTVPTSLATEASDRVARDRGRAESGGPGRAETR